MKCPVCGSEIELNECTRCGFVIMMQGGKRDDAGYMEAVRASAREYAEELKEEISVGLIAYSYEEKDGKLVLSSEKNMMIAKRATDIPMDSILWCPENFARVESSEPLQIRIFISDSAEKRYRDVSVPVPAEKGLWRIGCKGEENMCFRLLLGTPEQYSESEPVSLLK